jgi:hypothetical protein
MIPYNAVGEEVEEFDDEDQNALTFQPTHSIM